MTTKKMHAIDALHEAQKLAFSPLFFQAVLTIRNLGILDYIFDKDGQATIEDIVRDLGLSDYGVRLLVEAAESAGALSVNEAGLLEVTKTGFFILKDRMTQVNFNFVQDVCYEGARVLEDCVKNGKPEGLKVFGNWPTVYEGLSQLPDQVKKSWFEFDHFYSDNAFPSALRIVFDPKPAYIFDIGGNTGKWSMLCCEYDPDVRVKILDLPGQLAVSRENARQRNLLERIDFHQINLLDTSQKIPHGADVIWMSQFLDCFAVEEIVAILKNVCQASNQNTRIYILEPFFDNQKYAAAKHSLIGTSLYFTTIANGNSKMYSVEVMKNLVSQAGLVVSQEYPLLDGSYHTLLECRKA